MEDMPKKPKAPKTTPRVVPPSRQKLKYVPFPKDLWEKLKALGKADERSVAYMIRVAAREFIDRNGD